MINSNCKMAKCARAVARLAAKPNHQDKVLYFHNMAMEVFASESFFITFATAISKSSCVT